MVQRKHIVAISMMAIVVLLIGMTGCSRKKSSQVMAPSDHKVIAVLGKEDYVYADEGFINGMEMALEDGSSNISWEYYDDNGDYEQGLMMAQQLALDNQIVAVYSFQDFEVIDAEAVYFEKAKKPLIAVQGCYESTLEQGYQYIFSAYMSSKDMGVAMAKYCARKGYERVVCSHTNSTFEADEMKGFCAQAEKDGISIVDMQLGPDSMNDLEVAYQRWKQLDVNALYICKYTENIEQKEWIFKLIQYVKQQDPDFLVMGDYSLNGQSYLEKYGAEMEGTTYPNPYPVVENENSKSFMTEYGKRFPEESIVSEGVFQAYDLTQMVQKSVSQEYDGFEMSIFKSEQGYDGVSGTINYSEDGRIIQQVEYLTVHQGAFVKDLWETQEEDDKITRKK